MTADQIAELKRWIAIANQPYKPRYMAAKQDARAMVTRFAPALIAALEAAEAERDALQEESAYVKHQLEWVEESGDTYTKSALMDFIRRTLHAINHTATIKEAIAARDARMKAEGAIEALEDIAKDTGVDGGKAYFATVVYREFPDLLTTKVGVVEAADIMTKAAELRKKGGV